VEVVEEDIILVQVKQAEQVDQELLLLELLLQHQDLYRQAPGTNTVTTLVRQLVVVQVATFTVSGDH
jgi:hypothetical protein